MSADEQHDMLKKREKYTPKTLINTDARRAKGTFEDRILFDAVQCLERGNYTGCFLSLYRHAAEGKLDGAKTFAELCQVFEDQLRHQSSDNKNQKYGIRYPQNYLNFMILIRSGGGSTAKQYELLTAELGGPSLRQLRCVLLLNSIALTSFVLY